MRIDKAMKELQASEADLAKGLRHLGDRHPSEPDVHHLAHDLAHACSERLERLRPFAERYGAETDGDNAADSTSVISALRTTASRLVSGQQVAGLALLTDVRDVYVLAQRAEIDWTILQQAVIAARDLALLPVVQQCHEEVETCGKWLRTTIKVNAPQTLVAG